ncbi:cullin-3-like [Dermacentor variabilis]|uniref:cullin-3-like n=1 Tax=Dermacentor variabilis TaxID=34621 RepID=UPI003F5C456A
MAGLPAEDNAEVVRIKRIAQRAGTRRTTEDLWLELRRAFTEAQETRTTGKHFGELYYAAYTMVVRNRGARLYCGVREVVTEHLTKKVRPFVLAKAREDDFLQALIQAWRNHQRSATVIGAIVVYMDNVFVPRNNVDSVPKLFVSLFRDEVVRRSDVRNRLRETLLGLVKAEREGTRVDRTLMKEVCGMLASLGLGRSSVYQEDFEGQFLAESAKFYALRGQTYVEMKDALHYIARVEQHVDEESERARQCLDESTAGPVVQVVLEQLVGKHMKAIVDMEDSGVVHMLENRKTEDLRRTFLLLKRVQGGVKTLLDCVSKYLRDLGRSIASEHGDSVSLVPKVMELKDRFDYFLQHCFDGEPLVKETMETDFEYILNLTRTSAEHLSTFVDDVLRNRIKCMTKQKIDQLLDKIVAIFRFLQEKDLFELHYRQGLANRLLLDDGVAADAEKTMVNKLGSICGSQFTYKMETMFKDLLISGALMKQFKAILSSCDLCSDGVDLDVRVLRTGFWALPAATQQINIPSAPRNAFEMFRLFYMAKHDGRRLILQPHLGWAEMNAVFREPWKDEASSSRQEMEDTSSNKTQAYTIQVSTYQMCLLMLFNSRDRMSCEEIASETEIPEKDLVHALSSLCTGKASERLLNKMPDTVVVEKDHVFAVNDAFTPSRQRVKIPSCEKDCAHTEYDKSLVANLGQERKYATEAAVVRIMKARKKLSHKDLVAEVVNQLRARFTPTAAELKKVVDDLVGKEYLERATEDPEVYIYIP